MHLNLYASKSCDILLLYFHKHGNSLPELHDNGVDEGPELAEVGLESLVCGGIVEATDKYFPARFCQAAFAVAAAATSAPLSAAFRLGGGSLRLDLRAIDDVGAAGEAGLCLFQLGKGYETEPPEKSNMFCIQSFR